MFLPLHDQIGLKFIRRPYVTHALIVANIVIWLITTFMPNQQFNAIETAFGFIPATIFAGAHLDPQIAIVAPTWTFLTYAFFHEGFVHMASNMLFLFVFGDNVEDAMGHGKFLVFYLACAVFAALIHGLIYPDLQLPLVGASGAISGVLSAYILLHPRVRVWMLVFFGLPLPLPAFIPLALWMAEQFYMLATGAGGGVSFAAHAGGILSGAVLMLLMKRREVPLFDRDM
jgi:membrane associated rhomboid family serine protease